MKLFQVISLFHLFSCILAENEHNHSSSMIDKPFLFLTLLLCCIFYPETSQAGRLWAVLVAGSSGYYNYRHQADICHAYHVLHNHGVPDSNIIVMMYDDIANNTRNPTPGIIINHPHGMDVYRGVLKDYTGEDVTSENFLRVLRGDEKGMAGIGSGKVVKSGRDDLIFVNFADHGAPGLLAFPSDELKASSLSKVITDMHNKQRYLKMVFYVESCESGSMFSTTLRSNIGVYATTASNAHEPSYACYFDEKRQTYLGDVYSTRWMQDSDMENVYMESLQQQFNIVRNETNTSHVQEYGDLHIGDLPVGDFQGAFTHKALPRQLLHAPLDVVPSPDVELAVLEKQLKSQTHSKERMAIKRKIQDILEMRKRIDKQVTELVVAVTASRKHQLRLLTGKHDITHWHCYDKMVSAFSSFCFRFAKYEYALRKISVLVNMCEENIAPTEKLVRVLMNLCRHRNNRTLRGIF